ncbi:Fungal transcriptional regulatory protein [Cordyceps fumosorosea ARSEF 2679]|uniref:Fungal transcriptional regulatory protein n=1 Tax=Cordyceps fumosorosea (strain ARSEF 2679) TaxID=1081104 RepID=A0A168BY79_CORFA|nr:Fungal transcriptional regulatory protein [Cordyceps fumosorosea ARSEF 2679]OAA70701.1 Fungal transcriptional regulatory protein [Cordyceps fumosorosea ARSEF 2679]
MPPNPDNPDNSGRPGDSESSSAAAAARTYVCATCGKRYQRNTHLRRHEATHAATGKFRCIYCDKEFGRGCIKKDFEVVVPELRRGRKPQACEACFTSKVSCDKGHPCGRCLLRRLPCRPREVASAAEEVVPKSTPSSSSSSAPLETPHTQASSASSRLTQPAIPANSHPHRADESMPWIKNLINPHAASMLEHLADDPSSETERIPDMSFLSGGGDDPSQPSPASDPATTAAGDDPMEWYPWSYATMLDDALFNFDDADDINMLSLDDPADPFAAILNPFLPSPPSSSSSSAEGVEDTSLLLVNALRDLDQELRASDPTYKQQPAFSAAAVAAALSAANLRRLAATFFRLSHVHFPIVHVPSFRASSPSSRALLLSLAVQGAFRSPPLDDVLAVRGLLRLAEEYVFRELHDALAATAPRPPLLPTPAALEALQAALVIVYLLAINNSVSSRRQSRVRRIPELAWVVRHLDLMNVRHAPGEGWRLFVHRETCIRIATWTAVADWHQCGMFRCMPIMATTELNCDHPCSTAVWDAADEAEFAAAVAGDEKRLRSGHHSPSPSSSAASSTSGPSSPVSAQSNIRQFIDILMADKWNRAEQCPRDSYNIHDLSTAAVALSNVAITADIMSMMPFTAPALLRSLARWQELWADLIRELGTAALMKTGMSRHSNEMAHLTRKIVEASINKSKHPFFQKVGHETVTELYSFVIHG